MMAKSRRGNGEGSIYQRNDGTWCATIGVGYDANGKRRRRTLFGRTKADVLKTLAEESKDVAHMHGVEAEKITLGKYLDRWLRDAAKPTLKATTYANYERAVEKSIKPHLGGVKLAKLTALQIHGMYSTLEKAGASPDKICTTHAVLHRALKLAVRWRLLPFNVCADVERPKVERKAISPLSVEEARRLIESAHGERFEAIYVLAVTAGMRLGELLGLYWSDVDLKGRVVMVQRALQELNGKLTLKEPKSARSRRRIDIPQMAVDALIRHRAQMLAEGLAGVDLVFCNGRGGPMRRTHFHSQHFKRLLKAAGMRECRFHDLRHTSATLLLSQGVHPKVVQERLGHSQISVTLDTYSHVLPSMQVEAAGKFDAILERQPPESGTVPAVS